MHQQTALKMRAERRQLLLWQFNLEPFFSVFFLVSIMVMAPDLSIALP
jgi:hypothetical protein